MRVRCRIKPVKVKTAPGGKKTIEMVFVYHTLTRPLHEQRHFVAVVLRAEVQHRRLHFGPTLDQRFLGQPAERTQVFVHA